MSLVLSFALAFYVLEFRLQYGVIGHEFYEIFIEFFRDLLVIAISTAEAEIEIDNLIELGFICWFDSFL